MQKKKQNNKNVPNLRFKGFEGEWERKKLGEIGEVITGSTPPTNDESFYDGEYLFVSPADIQSDRFIYRTKTTLTEKGFKKGRKIRKGSLLFVCIGSTIGKIAQAAIDCITNQQINSVVPIGNNDDFVFSLLEFHSAKIKMLSTEQAVPIINKTTFLNYEVLAPLLEEQEKIASFLFIIDERIQTQNKIIAQLQTLMQGFSEQLFKQQILFKDENGNDFPAWKEKVLREIIKISSGLSQDQNNSNGYKVTRIETISNGIINIDKVGFVDTDLDISEYKITKGDVLFSNINSVSHIGKTAIAKDDLELYHGMNLLRLRSLRSISPLFLFYALNTSKQRNHFRSICNQAVNQASINQTELGKIKIMLPSIPEQQKINRLLSSIDKKIETEKKILQQYENQKRYLLQNMFI
ncbi:MAG: restriction endonuclease subunit S [Chitinophagaceae bacterium]|nr:restriction endonuclease subunit S [Chitinophagaceae bacterium]